MFNHNSKSRETLDSINHRPCPLRLFEPSPTAVAPLSTTKPGNGEHSRHSKKGNGEHRDVSSLSLSPPILNFHFAESLLPVLLTLICLLLII
ncbi:hypothetical protein Hdeb2414_s0511g00907991 [Helianthus debilis subsp. tardiflorus]